MKKKRQKTRRVIFLDIDGVLQPHGQQDRFKHDLDKLREDLAVKFKNDDYLEMDKYDLGAVQYDWHQEAVERLRKLCIDIPAEIVISSDWRRYSPLARLKDYFKLHDLHRFVTDVIDQIPGKYRCGEVTEYLNNNPDIHRFVILDDAHTDDFSKNYPAQFVYCRNFFREDDYELAVRILTTNYHAGGPSQKE